MRLPKVCPGWNNPSKSIHKPGWNNQPCGAKQQEGRLWCPTHEAQRIAHINAQFDKIRALFDSPQEREEES